MPFRLRFKVAPGLYYGRTLGGPGRGRKPDRDPGDPDGGGCLGCALVVAAGMAALTYFRGDGASAPVAATAASSGPGVWHFVAFVVVLGGLCALALRMAFGRRDGGPAGDDR